MNDTQRGILNLIRSAITKKPFPLPDGFRLEDAEKLINSHQIHGLVYEGAVLCGIPKTDPVMGRLFQKYCQLIIRNHAQMTTLETLYAAFEENGIDYLPVKGCVLKELYPNPAMRTMGDADVLIHMEQYDQIRAIVESLGYTLSGEADHAIPWRHKDLLIELHRSLIPSFQTREYAYFKDVWQRAVPSGGHRFSLTQIDFFIFIFLHYVKHYRDGGIGLRQLTDLWLLQMLYPEMDMELIRGELDKLNLLQFFDYTQKMLCVWFLDETPDERALFMTEYIFSSGSWGTSVNVTVSRALRIAAEEGSNKKARGKLHMGALFPSSKILSKRYPVLKQVPWLTPLFWPYRWVTAVLFRRDNIQTCYSHIARASDENMQARQQALSYVGLDFSSYK